MEFGVSWFVVVVFYVPTGLYLQYRYFLKIISDDFAHALSSGLTSKNASKKNSPQAAKETAHVNAIS